MPRWAKRVLIIFACFILFLFSNLDVCRYALGYFFPFLSLSRNFYHSDYVHHYLVLVCIYFVNLDFREQLLFVMMNDLMISIVVDFDLFH